jgi:hypothetical protein
MRRGFLLTAGLSVKDEGNPPTTRVVQGGELADQFLSGGRRFLGMQRAESRPSVKDAMTIDEEVSRRGIRREPRNGAHPAAGLGALAPDFA